MPQRKSARCLTTLCMETLLENLHTLQDEALRLPKHLIYDLYDKWYEQKLQSDRVACKRKPPPPFPADLFCHSRPELVHSLDFFDRPADEVVDKINRLSKNIQKIYLKNINFINVITINNPNIMVLDLFDSECTNQHLSIISKNCPQLQCLTLNQCDHVTDDGINFLPEKLTELNLPRQITTKGLLNALNRLLCLKILRHIKGWHDVLEMCAASLVNRVGNRAYNIEKLQVNLNKPTIYDIPNTVRTLFPKIQKLSFRTSWNCSFGSRIRSFLEVINHDLLTTLILVVSADVIQIVAHLCPMLKVLYIYIGSERLMLNDRYLAKPQHIPFKYLCQLHIDDDLHAKLSTDDLKMLLTNCQKLESLTVQNCDKLSDEFIYYILSINPLKYVKYLSFTTCGPFGIEAVDALLKSLHSVMHIIITKCYQISTEDKVTITNLISQMNWNLQFCWDCHDSNAIIRSLSLVRRHRMFRY